MLEKMLLNPEAFRLSQGVALVRIIIGLLMVYHGQEVFNGHLMQEYAQWEAFAGPYATLLVYLGKSAELLSGVLLTLGLCTRLAALILIATLSYITFIIGQGRFWYQEQHPFLFVLFGLLFLFAGPGAWSLDRYLYTRKGQQPE
jgi:putative oxidoreductase